MASPAEVVSGTKLNERAAITSDNFPGIYRGESCGHQVLGVARAGLLRRPLGTGSQAQSEIYALWMSREFSQLTLNLDLEV